MNENESYKSIQPINNKKEYFQTGTKRERKHNAKDLPEGIEQHMMKKYVVYYHEWLDKEHTKPREYFKIETHPKLDKIYENVLNNNKMVTAEFKNTSSNSHIMHFMPSTKFIGCVKECKKMKEFINHLEILYSSDYSNSINIQDLVNKWLLMKSQNDVRGCKE